MESRNNEDCSICLEPLYLLGSGESLLSTPCNHLFHCRCLSRWFEIGAPGNCCPLCKRQMVSIEATPVTLEQANSVARRSTRTATMISTSASTATSRPASSARTRGSRAPVARLGPPRPTPPAGPGGEMPMSSEDFQRNIQRILAEQGSFRAFEVALQSLTHQTVVPPPGSDLGERTRQTRLQLFNGIREPFERVQEDHREIGQASGELMDFYRNWIARIQGAHDNGQMAAEESRRVLQELLGVQRSYFEFENRYMAVVRQLLDSIRTRLSALNATGS